MPENSDQHHSHVKKKVTVNNNGGHISALFEQRLKGARKNSRNIHIVLQRYCVVIPLVARASDNSLSTNQHSAVSGAPPFWYWYYCARYPKGRVPKKWYGTVLWYCATLNRTTPWKRAIRNFASTCQLILLTLTLT